MISEPRSDETRDDGPDRRRTSIWSQLSAFDEQYWLCIVMEMLERLAYYGVRVVLPVYLVLAVPEGGAGLTHTQKGLILASFGATQTLLPTFIGGVCDRYGYRRSIAVSILLKSAGYATMAAASGFWGMLTGIQLLAAGTGLFKPGVQGALAHSISKTGAGSMGWGVFYQTVNIGAALAVYIPALTRDVYGFGSLFAACSLIVLLNFALLGRLNEPAEVRAGSEPEQRLLSFVASTFWDVFRNPRLLLFIIISSGFWFSFHQLFDMLPNYVDDWTDSSILLGAAGGAFGVQAWIDAAARGEMIPQERLLSINPLMIMFTMFVFAWASSSRPVLAATAFGMLLATVAIVPLAVSASVWTVVAALILFTVGEMLSSPKRQEYFASLAPPSKRGLYLGYSNMPDGIGWVLGSLIAGSTYDVDGDKIELARRFLHEEHPPTSVDVWNEQVATFSDGELEEACARVRVLVRVPEGVSDRACALNALLYVERNDRLAEILPRGRVVEHIVAAVPVLPNGIGTTPRTLAAFLYDRFRPGRVWIPFFVVSALSVIAMYAFHNWTSRLRGSAAFAGSND